LLLTAIVGAPYFLIRGYKKTCELWAPGEGWIHQNIVLSIHHDPATFIGMPKAWRNDYWNCVDVLTILCLWSVIRRSMTSIDEEDTVTTYLNIVSVTILLLFAKCSKFFLEFGLKFAAFVNMLSELVKNISVFMVVFLYVLVAFSAVMLMRHAGKPDEAFFDDSGEGRNPFNTPQQTFATFYDLIFGFELPVTTNVLDPFDQILIMIFLFIVVIVMLNVLIAIVSDSYAEAMAAAFETYWLARLELVSEIITTFHVPGWIKDYFKKYHVRSVDMSSIRELVYHEFLSNDGAIWSREDELIDRIKKEMRGETLQIQALVESQNKAIAGLLILAEEQQRGHTEIRQALRRGPRVPIRSPLRPPTPR